ncbi:MAG TPA: capsule assembly Wzi family protein [Gemmatimonadaceae bacterium]
MQLTGVAPLASRLLRPASDAPLRTADDSAQWRSPWSARSAASSASEQRRRLAIGIIAPVFEGSLNSQFPSGMNDGAMWAGRGASVLATAGAVATFGPVSLQLAPSFTWSQNTAFALGPLHDAPANASQYADVWAAARIDRPQRFGDAEIRRMDAGQSSLRVDYRGFAAGVSNENMWWGPGVDNSLLMSNTAGGFGHVFIGTGRAHDIRIGKIEALWTVGALSQSSFWRTAPDTIDRRRWLNALLVVFEPRGLRGLYLGAGRVFYANERYDPVTGHELLTVFQPFKKEALATPTNPTADDTRDQLLSLSARWVFPESGFEVYGEFGRNDHSWDLRDATLEPDHSRATLIGLQKAQHLGQGLLVLRAEATNLALTRTSTIRSSQSWYIHHIVQQGYTERGQLLGAGIGPGSDMQSFTADWFIPRGRLGLVFARRRENSDAFYSTYKLQSQGYQDLHDVTTGVGPRVTWFAGPLDIQASILREHEYNRYTILRNDKLNVHGELRLEWHGRGGRPAQ